MPTSKADRDERIERQAGQYVGMGSVVLVVQGDAPHKDTGI